jgi:hypothetical protein
LLVFSHNSCLYSTPSLFSCLQRAKRKRGRSRVLRFVSDWIGVGKRRIVPSLVCLILEGVDDDFALCGSRGDLVPFPADEGIEIILAFAFVQAHRADIGERLDGGFDVIGLVAIAAVPSSVFLKEGYFAFSLAKITDFRLLLFCEFHMIIRTAFRYARSLSFRFGFYPFGAIVPRFGKKRLSTDGRRITMVSERGRDPILGGVMGAVGADPLWAVRPAGSSRPAFSFAFLTD